MNLYSFADELMKIGAMDPLMDKHAQNESMPTGMVGSDPMPETLLLRPDEAASRVPLTATLPPAVSAGTLGRITQATSPVDNPTFESPFTERRRS
jgi:hypothetical protein